MACGVSVDAPGFRAWVQHVSEWVATCCFDDGTRLREVIDQQVKVNLQLASMARPLRGFVIGDAMEREASDRLPVQRQPLVITGGRCKIQDLLPEECFRNRVLALKDELREASDCWHLSMLGRIP